MKRPYLVILSLTAVALLVVSAVRAGTSFGYSGSLVVGGVPANGAYDFQFTLCNAPSGGATIGGTVTKLNVNVVNGAYTVSLDFGANTFSNPPLFMKIAFRKSGTPTYTTITTRPQHSVRFATISNTTNGLQGRAVATTAPATGQALKWTGSAWTPAAILDWPLAASASSNYEVLKVTNTGGGQAILGVSAGSIGLWGRSTSYTGVQGQSISYYGVNGFSDTNHGVVGSSNGAYGTFGVYGYAGSGGNGVGGVSTGFYGVYGYSYSTAGGYFESGSSEGGNGVEGISATGYGGYFDSLAANDKRFVIDHPLDPANSYLSHSCVESDERLNVYSGTAALSANGHAWVKLPDYFEALNRDFRYQLTAIGAPGPNLFIGQEISGGRFQIAGGRPGMKVSWQVTGVRQDAYAKAHPFEVEKTKPERERGLYLNPKEHGMPESLRSGPPGSRRMPEVRPPARLGAIPAPTQARR